LSAAGNAEAWGLPRVLDFFTERRNSTGEIYESEWFFLKDRLREGVSVLDVGCAQGGFASALAEHLSDFAYTGVDINAEMIERARAGHPDHAFYHVPETDFSALGGARFDVVLVLGILHLHEAWRETLRAAWSHAGGALILDLRQTDGATIEDVTVSSFRMDFNGGDPRHTETRLPYNIINAGEALRNVRDICAGSGAIRQYGYEHAVSDAADCPVETVLTTVWCVDR
jgi:SAM-dependent methyltransferase